MSQLTVNQLSKCFSQKQAVNQLSVSVEPEKDFCLAVMVQKYDDKYAFGCLGA